MSSVAEPPDAAGLGALRLAMTDGRRIDEIERRAYELARRRLDPERGKSVGPAD